MAPKRKAGVGKGPRETTKETVKEHKESEEVTEEEEAPAASIEEDADGEEGTEERPGSKKAKAESTKNGAKRGRKAKVNTKNKSAEPKENDVQPEQAGMVSAPLSKTSKVIIIEASKECNSIKTRATKVQAGLKDSLPGLEVLVNPDKPRKGCFEIRDGEGNVYLSLLEMPRPYTNLKSLDLDTTVKEIVAKIK